MTTKHWLKGELADSLKRLLQDATGATVQVLDAAATTQEWNRCRTSDDAQPRLVTNEDTLLIFLYKPRVRRVAHALRVTFPSAPMPEDIQFCRCLLHTFEEDVQSARNQAPWEALTTSRIARAIAAYVPLPTPMVSNWLELAESSISLTYEGKPVRYTALFLNSTKDLEARSGSLYVKLSEPMDIEDALLRQKWIRAAFGSRPLALVIDGRRKKRRQVTGLLCYSALPATEPRFPFAPHDSLLPLQSFLGSRDMVITASSHGDIFALLGNGIVFQKSQGAWRYLNYESAQVVLSRCWTDHDANIALKWNFIVAVLRLALDLSFQRVGALIVILDRHEDLNSLVPDNADPHRPSRALRESIVGLSIVDWTARQVIAGVASVDGATVLSRNGQVLDAAAMVARPSREALQAVVGADVGRTFEGARSTAAWNASIFGTSLKISEDGPITIYRHGKRILHLGIAG
ncbi:hypothetical protein [Sorangium atrum]|uniref:DAC domain-containing protein n=1 Tax=Sorangium atrum TaxID=2995308 RepID=A0ABT5CAD6_9BACT|nr:hypothetical protein [Sorangium aterium]MDC0683394.1 hypothetical protein [Sorangium aterium]